MLYIPKIIHQIWSEKYKPLPKFFQVLSETWKTKHPDWKYIHWNEKAINDVIQSEFSELCDFYNSLPFDIQRWDMVRFLIMNKYGGLYADFDYECLENIEPLLENRTCCIGLEPDSHCMMYNIPRVLNAALFASVPNALYIKKIIEKVIANKIKYHDTMNKAYYILKTTGPLMLSEVYENMTNKEKKEVYLIPAKYVTPFNNVQIEQVKAGVENDELENCLQDAYAIHYFSTTWIPELNNSEKSSISNSAIEKNHYLCNLN